MFRNFMIRLSIIFATLLLLSACNSSKEVHNDTILEITLNPEDKDLSPADIMEVIGWTELKLDSAVWIGNPTKIESAAGEYFVFERYPSQCVFRFSSDGKFLSKIGKIGNGEGEYLQAYDFYVDEDGSKIYILSDKSTLYVYGKDGTYINKVQISDNLICNLCKSNDGLLGSTGYADITNDGNNYLIYKYDSDWKVADKWVEYSNVLLPPYSIALKNPFISNGNNIYFVDKIKASVFDINQMNDNGTPNISFKLENPMPIDAYADFMNFIELQGKHNWIMDTAILDSSILVAYIFDGNYSVTQTDKNGVVLKSGVLNGMLPLECSYVSGDAINSLITAGLYNDLWANVSGIQQPDFEVSDNSILLMQWQLKNTP